MRVDDRAAHEALHDQELLQGRGGEEEEERPEEHKIRDGEHAGHAAVAVAAQPAGERREEEDVRGREEDVAVCVCRFVVFCVVSSSK